MKAILEFDLDDPNKDDTMHFKMAVKANDYYWALYDFKNARKNLEWEIDNNPDMNKYDVLYKTFDKFWAIIEDHNITFEH
jgi:hypothetical protein